MSVCIWSRFQARTMFWVLSCFLFIYCLSGWGLLATSNALLTSTIVQKKMQEVFREHCLYHEFSDELVSRQLVGLLEQLDPSKAYFIENEIQEWLKPSPNKTTSLKEEWSQGNFQELDRISQIFTNAIRRRVDLESQISSQIDDSSSIDREKLRKAPWPSTIEDLKERIRDLNKLQKEILNSIDDSRRELIAKRLKQMRQDDEEPFLSNQLSQRRHAIYQRFLHAFAESFDAHTVYFTPEEARQVANNLHRKITGIGVVLRDELDGYKILRIVESSPADLSGKLAIGDRIIAVDGQPTLGLDLNKGVLLIQGNKGSNVRITVQRDHPKDINPKGVQTFELSLTRDDVVLTENRYSVQEEAFGNGKIACISLYSFYQDEESNCADDLRREIQKMKADGKLQALILDLRYNLGGVLPTSADICGLFLRPCVVVSARTPDGKLTRIRQCSDEPVWEGPLIVLVSRSSASCSEIVTGTLQDFGRALVVGDPHTYGKGTFQLFTLRELNPDPYGVFTITQGIYYTVSGRSPQLTGVKPDIVVAGPLSELEIGEQTLKYPLPNQSIEPCFEDTLDDLNLWERQRLKRSYLPKLQKRMPSTYQWLDVLKSNSQSRLDQARKQQNADTLDKPLDAKANPGEKEDLQLRECLNIAKDWVYLLHVQEDQQAI